MDDEALQAIFRGLFDIRRDTQMILRLLTEAEDDDGPEEEEDGP